MSIIDLDNGLGFMDHDEENCELYFNLYLPPISHQSKNKEAKQRLQASIRKVLENIDFYVIGDISFHLLWNLHEHRRIETDGAADIDNILKPIIDGFTGFGALIIDDNQIDDVHAQWGHYYDYENDKFVVTIKYEPNQLINKDSLFLLQLEKNIYIPIECHPDRDSRVAELKDILAVYNKRKTDIESEGYDRGTRRKNRMQRLFHVGRIDKNFSKGSQSEYLG
jgi:Holliday junction resolvase RusA-like endonuclease